MQGRGPQFASVLPGVPIYEHKPFPASHNRAHFSGSIPMPSCLLWTRAQACYGGDSPQTCQFGNSGRNALLQCVIRAKRMVDTRREIMFQPAKPNVIVQSSAFEQMKKELGPIAAAADKEEMGKPRRLRGKRVASHRSVWNTRQASQLKNCALHPCRCCRCPNNDVNAAIE